MSVFCKKSEIKTSVFCKKSEIWVEISYQLQEVDTKNNFS